MTKKETSEQKFIKTEYGKKLYKNMIIWTVILIVAFVIEMLLYIPENEDLALIAGLLSCVNWGILAFSLYTDGKYKGALEMYNKRLK